MREPGLLTALALLLLTLVFTNVLEGEFPEVRIAPVLCVIPSDRPYLSGGPGLLGVVLAS
jgi:hypothetical protein